MVLMLLAAEELAGRELGGAGWWGQSSCQGGGMRWGPLLIAAALVLSAESARRRRRNRDRDSGAGINVTATTSRVRRKVLQLKCPTIFVIQGTV